MKKKDSRLRIRTFYGLLILPTVLWLLFSAIGLGKQLDYDTGEKRNKHQLSEDMGLSNVTSELDSYYNDRVPFRSVMLTVNSTVNYITELPYTKVIEPLLLRLANAALSSDSYAGNAERNETSSESTGTDTASVEQTAGGGGEDTAPDGSAAAAESSSGEGSDSGTDQAAAATAEDSGKLAVLPATYETPVESGYYPFKELSPEVIQGRDGWLFTTESYMDFTGENMPSGETLKEKLDMLVTVDQLCKNKGIEFHVFAMPNKNVVYPEYMPSVEQAEYSAANALEDYVHQNSAVSFQYLDDELLGSKIYGQLYYKLDTHWNNRGGLAAYAYMRNTLGLSPIDLSSIQAVQSDEYTGDLSQYTGLPSASFETEYSLDMLYKPETAQQVLRSGEDYIDEIVTETAENNRTVVLIGDSFRHSLLPYLSRDYTHVYSMNEKLLDDEMAAILNSADMIILESVERNMFFETHYDTALSGLGAVLQQ